MDKEKIKKILKYTTYVDKFKYHNQIINFLDKFYTEEDFPKTLINFDLHSDMKLDYACIETSIANWVNHTFGKYGIEEYYWVIPKHAFYDKKFMKFLEKDKNKSGGNYTQTPYTDFSKPLKQRFPYRYIKNKVYTDVTQESDEKVLEYIETQEKKHKLIHVYYCTEDNLPDFAKEDVIVSVDADYFSNNGYDTYSDYKYTPKNIQEEFDKFIDCMYEKHIYPTYMGLCISNNYAGDLESSEKFYNQIIDNFKCPVKVSIDYTYTDLRDDNYQCSNVYFYTLANYIEIVYKDNPKISDDEVKKILSEKNNYENGTYVAKMQVKESTDDSGNPQFSVYKHDITVTKIAEENIELNLFLNKIKSKMEEISKN